MEKIYKKILLILLIPIIVYAQTSPPSGYTTHYKFRMWAQGARPSADSINQNWKDIDSVIYMVSQSVTIDTTDIAYKSKVNNFTNSNSFEKADFNEIIFNNKILSTITYYEAASGNITSLFNTTPTIVFVDAGFDTVTIHGFRYLTDGQILRLVNYSSMSIKIKNNSSLATHYKILTPDGQDLVLQRGYYHSVELIGISYAGTNYYLVVSKNF